MVATVELEDLWAGAQRFSLLAPLTYKEVYCGF